MKKIYLSAFVLLASTITASAQVIELPYGFTTESNGIKEVLQTPNDHKALGVTIWNNEFDNPGDWTLDNDGQTGPIHGWNINTTSEAWFSSFTGGMNSTSGGNYAEVQNGNYNNNNQALNVTYTMTIAAPVNIPALSGGITSVSLQFEQWGALFNDAQTVEVSTNNGASWEEVYSNSDKTVFVGNNPSAIYPNPEVVTVNITNAIAADPTNVQFRFVWTSRNQAGTTLAWWTTFGWYIDDVKIITNPDNDLATSNPYWGTLGLNYYQIPQTQVAPIDFAVEVTNNGINNQTNAQLNVTVSGAGTANPSSTGTTVFANTMDTLEIISGFTPSALGTYTIDMDISQDQVDDVPSNDVIASDAFQVVDFIYARDNGTADGTFNNGGDGYKLCNWYDIFADQTVYSIQTRLSNTSNVGAEFQAVLYRIPATATTFNDIVQIGFSDFIQVTSSNVNTIIDLPLLFPVDLQADSSYFAAIVSAGDNGATNDVVVSTAGQADVQTVFLYDDVDAQWYYTTRTPIIRLNFENTANVEELDNNIALNVYPNPANDVVNVSFALNNNSDVNVEVVDITGKVVANVAGKDLLTGSQNISVNTTSLAAGLYTVVVDHNGGKSSTKFIKR